MLTPTSNTHPSTAAETEQITDDTDSDHDEHGALAFPQHVGEDVEQGGVHGDHHRELRAQAQGDQHEEEHDGPQRGDGQAGHHLRVDDERQAGSCKSVLVRMP